MATQWLLKQTQFLSQTTIEVDCFGNFSKPLGKTALDVSIFEGITSTLLRFDFFDYSMPFF